MKKMMLIAALLMAASGVKAQDCDAIMLPYFNGNVEQLNNYRKIAPEKFMYRCVYARTAFYESDTVPAGAEVMDISVVREKATGKNLSRDVVVDLESFSYYAFNFDWFQFRNRDVHEVTCFATPGSHHPYLVLRSLSEMEKAANDYLDGALKSKNR